MCKLAILFIHLIVTTRAVVAEALRRADEALRQDSRCT